MLRNDDPRLPDGSEPIICETALNQTDERLWDRTIGFLQALHSGNTLTVAGMGTLCMGENFDVGFKMTNVGTGEEFVTGELTIGQLAQLLKQYDIWPLPRGGRR